jgi:UDP:flavonoid glycosyltransferase YjiC (YdhE family)
MGFTWRGKGSQAPEVVEGAEATGAEVLPNMSETTQPERNLSRFKNQHQWDPFLDIEKIDAVDAGLASGDPEKQAAVEDSLIADDSPYPEVRSAVCFSPLLPFFPSPLSPIGLNMEMEQAFSNSAKIGPARG